MTKVISVKFKDNGKAYFFDPGETDPEVGEKVVVETAKGIELGECVLSAHEVEDDSVVQPLRSAVRVATEADLRIAEANKEREREALDICRRKIAEHGLDMKLVDVERSFDGSKILFFFTADGRVDFRNLVKDLASVFRTRIELRQIGVRDEAKLLGGIGICGQKFCCSRFLTDFQPVSTKMAKVQSMSLNPAKISGNCGRLMCCLRYEHEAYEDMIKHSPKTGAYVETEMGYGTVSQVNLLRHQVKVRMDGTGEAVIKSCDIDDVAVVPGGRPPEGETPPHVLQPRVKPAVEEPEEDPWDSPDLFAGELSEPRKPQQSTARDAGQSTPSKHRRNKQGQKQKDRKQGQKQNRDYRQSRENRGQGQNRAQWQTNGRNRNKDYGKPRRRGKRPRIDPDIAQNYEID